jgi:hypothetical protein
MALRFFGFDAIAYMKGALKRLRHDSDPPGRGTQRRAGVAFAKRSFA